jgi:putative oxidoreductase
MMIKQQLFTSKGLWNAGAIILRVIAGLTIFKFGLELFADDKMNGYRDWLTDLHFPAPMLMAKMGKICELAGGALLVLGLFTRLAAIALIITMIVIAFVMGDSEVLNADSPFLLLLIFLHFLFTGPGKWSLDHLLFERRKIQHLIKY